MQFGPLIDEDIESIHTFSIRAVFSWPLLPKLNWCTELGPAYLHYINKSYVAPAYFSNYNYDVVKHLYNLIGLSIQNSISISKNKAINLYVYNSINTKFSHTVVGIQYHLGKTR